MACLRAGSTSAMKVASANRYRRGLGHVAAAIRRRKGPALDSGTSHFRVFVVWNRALCWIRRRHRWRVPNRALQVEFRHQTFRIRCADCGRERRMTGTEIQYRRVSGNWEKEL